MWLFDLFRKKDAFEKKLAKCGHRFKKKDKMEALGEESTVEVPMENGTTAYCHRCLEKMAIKCAWCGRAIFIGEPITLYTPIDKGMAISEQAVVYGQNPLTLVGCLRMDCAESGADRMGFWCPPGKVRRVLSPLEIAMNTKQMVIVSDLGDSNEKPTLVDCEEVCDPETAALIGCVKAAVESRKQEHDAEACAKPSSEAE